MKVSKETILYLKSFSQINQSIWVNSGNVLKTISPHKTVIASAVVDDEFETEFGIYDLSQFLGVISLFDDPDFKFHQNHVVISSDRSAIKFGFVSKKLIIAAPDKELDFPEDALTFRLLHEDFKKLMQSANVLGLPNLVLKSDNGQLVLTTIDTASDSSNQFSIELQETSEDINVCFRIDNLRIMSGDYDVSVANGISKFKGVGFDATYFIATESL